MEPGQVVSPGNNDQAAQQPDTTPTPPTDPPTPPPDPTPAPPPDDPPVTEPPGSVDAPAESAPAEQPLANGGTPQQEQAAGNPTRSDQPNPTQNPDEPPADPPDGPAPPPATPGQTPPPESNDVGSSLFSWEASEYVEHERTMIWYAVLGLAGLALIGFSILILKEWLGALVIVLMLTAVVVYARRPPRALNYQLTEAGISISGKLYPYEDFRSFALVPHGGIDVIELDPLRRFMPRISIFFDKGDEVQIVEILEEVLPRDERPADPIDRLSHYLKF